MVSMTENRLFFRHAAVFCALFLCALFISTSSASAERIFLNSPDGVQTQSNGFTTATDGATMNVATGIITAADGSVFNFNTGAYTPPAGAPIALGDPGGATQPGGPNTTITAPNGATVTYVQPFPGTPQYDPIVTMPDGTTYRTRYTTETTVTPGGPVVIPGSMEVYIPTQGHVITTPGNYSMYFRAGASSTYRPGSVVSAGGALQSPQTDVTTMISDIISTNPELLNNFVMLDGSQANAFYNAYDLTGATGTTRDDPPASVGLMAQALQSGNPIIFVPSATEFSAMTSPLSAYFEYAPFVMTDLTIFCQLQAYTPGRCSGITPGRVGTPGGPGVIDTSGTPSDGGIDISGIASALDLTADALGLVFAQTYEGGEQAMANWLGNWASEILPDFKNMTAQWHTAIIDKSRNYGSTIDGKNFAKSNTENQIAEVEIREDIPNSELTCPLTSHVPNMAKGNYIGRSITRGYSNALQQISLGGTGTPSEHGPTQDTSVRWKLYSRHFCDPAGNDGAAGCEPTPPTDYTAEPFYEFLIGEEPSLPFRQATDADISIENFLLKDTIDLSNEEEKLASYAILRNLVAPKVPDNLPDNIAEENPDVQAEILKRREIQALRDIPVSVISGIIGRRSSIPGTDPILASTLREMRERAGVSPDKISEKASYNETLLALTKERFFDPEYFVKVGGMTPAEIKQEQLGVELLTGIVQQDIYDLQEQMNALMAARASVKINRDTPGEDMEGEQPMGP